MSAVDASYNNDSSSNNTNNYDPGPRMSSNSSSTSVAFSRSARVSPRRSIDHSWLPGHSTTAPADFNDSATTAPSDVSGFSGTVLPAPASFHSSYVTGPVSTSAGSWADSGNIGRSSYSGAGPSRSGPRLLSDADRHAAENDDDQLLLVIADESDRRKYQSKADRNSNYISPPDENGYSGLSFEEQMKAYLGGTNGSAAASNGRRSGRPEAEVTSPQSAQYLRPDVVSPSSPSGTTSGRTTPFRSALPVSTSRLARSK